MVRRIQSLDEYINENLLDKYNFDTYESLKESKKETYTVHCYDSSDQFWSTEDEKIKIYSLEDAHKFGKKHCKKDGMWYSIHKDGNELFNERTKKERNKFITGYLSESIIKFYETKNC